jgi:diguanylate cyclase (GGDEF)-like protein/PAS domain S-box-containing protein
MVRDRQGRIVRFNRACEEATGYDSQDVERKRVWDFLLIPEEVGRDKAVFEELRSGRESNEYQSYWVTRDGRNRLISWSNSVLLDKNNDVEHVISTGIDITEKKQAEEQVQFLAYYDGLTSLPNRVLFKENLNQALAYSQRHERLMALLFLDLDRFKQINDTFGHSLGDLLLKGVAERLRTDVRISDCVARREANDLESSVGRFGGDEFTLLITDVSSIQSAAKIAQRILELIAEPFELDNQEIYITASIGISMHPHDGANADVLLKNADAAMYAAKERGKNGYNFYTPSMNSKTSTKLSLENDLRKAIGREEFVVYYQPKLDVMSGRVIGVEALLRWRHPSKGLLSPAEFIPLAEETGLIMPLGEWGLGTVCSQSLDWQKKGIPPLPIAVNLSCVQFRQKNLREMIAQTLDHAGLDPRLLELEITESTIMQNEEEAGRTLRKLKEMGIRISIDDFGTGFSSLSYLKRFTLDALKIDRSFIKDLTTDGDDRAITIAIIAMAHSLGLKVIAEGVETQQQLAFLREHGCDEVQGYLFSPPLAEPDIVALLNSDSLMELAQHFEAFQPSYS